MIGTETPATRITQPAVASALSATGGAFLAYKAVRTFGEDPYGAIEPVAGAAVGLVALLAFVSEFLAVTRSGRAGALSLVTLAGAVIADWLPAAPPRLIHLLPLGVAAGLPPREGSRSRRARRGAR